MNPVVSTITSIDADNIPQTSAREAETLFATALDTILRHVAGEIDRRQAAFPGMSSSSWMRRSTATMPSSLSISASADVDTVANSAGSRASRNPPLDARAKVGQRRAQLVCDIVADPAHLPTSSCSRSSMVLT